MVPPYIPHRKTLFRVFGVLTTVGGILLWFPQYAELTRAYLMGLSMAAFVVTCPLDKYLGDKTL